MSNNVSLPRTRSSFTLLERLRKRPPTATPSAPSPQTNGTFYKLPTELLIAIFCCGLDAKDIISLGRTCRLLHSISITNEPWTVVCEAFTSDNSHHSPPFVPPVLTNPSPLEKRKSSRDLKPPAVPKATPVETAQTYCKRILKIRNALRPPEPGDSFLPSIYASGSSLMRCCSADFITMSMSAEGDALAIALMHEVRIVDLITLRTTAVTLARKKNRGSLPTKPLIQIMVVTLNGRRNAFIETNLFSRNGLSSGHLVPLDSSSEIPESQLLSNYRTKANGSNLSALHLVDTFIVHGRSTNGSRTKLNVGNFQDHTFYKLPRLRYTLGDGQDVRVHCGCVFVPLDETSLIIHQLNHFRSSHLKSEGANSPMRSTIIDLPWSQPGCPITVERMSECAGEVTVWNIVASSDEIRASTARVRYAQDSDAQPGPNHRRPVCVMDQGVHLHPTSRLALSRARDSVAPGLRRLVNRFSTPASFSRPRIVSLTSRAGFEHVLTLVKTPKATTDYLVLSTTTPSRNVSRTLRVFRDGKESSHGLLNPGTLGGAVVDFVWSDAGGRVAVRSSEHNGRYTLIDIYTF